ncbi:MAG: biotin/lipoate A/B protein ligase family protein [Xenococcaceae cyanobacterium MO_167.B27]|nr:biotin/lipoate A/B protein ligase family protein [Xenococcaceae cyanobacterium MO_167.B27]
MEFSCIATHDTWRLIPWLEASGEVQMAIDSWLLEQHRLGKHPPTLRFYTWQPVAISLGYHQQDYPEYWHNITWQGKQLDIVRRATGGNAVLHQGDLTYSVVTSLNSGNRRAAYKYICQFLIAGWRSLGVELEYGASKEYRGSDNCFASATEADLVTTEGVKVIGSAQLRKRRAILQHGSMMLNPDAKLFEEVFKQPSPSNILDLIPRKCDRTIVTIIEALTKAAIDCFKISLIPQPLSHREWQDILSNHSLLRY